MLIRYFLQALGEDINSFFRTHIQETVTVLLALFGYINAKRSYTINNAPMVVPLSVDMGKSEILVKNIGKGIAQRLRTSDVTYLIYWPPKKLIEWKINFNECPVLEPQQERSLIAFALENGEKVKSDSGILMHLTFSSGSNEIEDKKKPFLAPKEFLMEYDDTDGIGYLTRAVIRDGRIKSVQIGRDYYRYIRNLRDKIQYRFSKMTATLTITYRKVCAR